MSLFDRILLFIYTLAVMAVLFALGLAAGGWTTPIDLLQQYLLTQTGRLAAGVIVVVFLVISIKFFLQSVAMHSNPVQATVYETGMGQVRVSADAIENLVRRVAIQVRGVREVIPRVVFASEGINVMIKVALSPETNIPQVSDEIQSNVSNYLEEVAGINIKSVKILVESISTESKTGTTRKLL